LFYLCIGDASILKDVLNDFDGIIIQAFGGKLRGYICIKGEHYAGAVINLGRKLFLFESGLDDFPEASPPCFDVATTEKSIGDVGVIRT